MSSKEICTHMNRDKVKIYIKKNIILPVFCMGVKLGLTVREEHRLRVYENSALSRISGPKRDEVTGE
jgi:hypothetical protein